MNYTIKQGDTLSGLAQKNGVSLQSILTANPIITDPNKIQSGASLVIPKSTVTPTTTIQNTSAQRATDVKTQTDYQNIVNAQPYSMGTVNVGNNPTTTPITPELKAFNQQMVAGNTNPYGTNTNTNTNVNGTNPPPLPTIQADPTSAITNLYTSGVTDPTAIYTELSKTIPNITTEQINTAVSTLAKDPTSFSAGTQNKLINDQLARLDKENADFMTQIDAMKATLSAEKASAVESIKANSQKARELLKNSYLTNKANTEKANYATDAFRYTTNQAEGVMAHQEQDFIVNMSAIDAEEKKLLLDASTAKSKGDWDLLQKKVTQFNTISDDKRNLISNMITVSTNNLKAIQEKAKLEAKVTALPTPAQAQTIAKSNATAIGNEILNMSDTEKETYIAKKAKDLNIGVDILKGEIMKANTSYATAQARLKKAQGGKAIGGGAGGGTNATAQKKAFIGQLNSIMTDKKTKINGQAIIDPNGFLTPAGYAHLANMAYEKASMPKATFIKQYSNYFYKDSLDSYGFTPQEKKLITASKKLNQQ